MGRQNIYRVKNVSSVMPLTMTQDLVDFLIENRTFLLNESAKKDAFKSRFSGHNYISEIVHRLVILGKDTNFSLLRLPSKGVSLKEVVDLNFITFDMKQLAEVYPAAQKSLNLLPELQDKLVINISDITRTTGDFSDISQFYYRVVRDILARNYYQSTGAAWLSPTLVRYTAKVYSMTMAARIARLFQLQSAAQSFVQTVFCAFYVGKMINVETAAGFLRSNSKLLGLPEGNDLTQILFLSEDVLGKQIPETLEEVCQLIDHYDHYSLKTSSGSRLNRAILNVQIASLYPESHIPIIGLEYPPYFLFLILLVLSGVRISLSFPMKNMNLIKEGYDTIDQLLKSSSVFNQF